MTFDTCKGIIYGMIVSALLSIPNSYLGAAQSIDANLVSINGQSVNGNNAVLKLKQLSIVNNAGTALVARSTGGNGHGIWAEGHGNAPNHGHGIFTVARGNDGNGIFAEGVGDGDGIAGWAQDGMGILGAAEENGNSHVGIGGVGSGSGAGFGMEGGPRGPGLGVTGHGNAGSTQLNGTLIVRALPGSNADGINVTGDGPGRGILSIGGANGEGIYGVGNGGTGGFVSWPPAQNFCQ